MHNLVTVANVIAPPRKPPLWYLGNVECATNESQQIHAEVIWDGSNDGSSVEGIKGQPHTDEKVSHYSKYY